MSDVTTLRLEHTLADAVPGLAMAGEPEAYPRPALVLLNDALAEELGLDVAALRAEGGRWFGGAPPSGVRPVALGYAGHQFGHLSPQLGDGRALLLGELLTPDGGRVDLQLKGTGPTPFSRHGDGRAALDSVLREYVVSEGMHALGVPTTRALAAVTTGEQVRRYRVAPGAVLARVASSHLRVGTLEYLAVLGDREGLEEVVRYALWRHFPDRADAEVPALALLEAVADAQAFLIARWMHVGFVHGVMNTDNMSLCGETLDYGPCAFMERTDPSTVFSVLDHAGRYAYGRQPGIGMWNLARMAEAVLPLLAEDANAAVALAQGVLERYRGAHQEAWLQGMRRKLGLIGAQPGDDQLAQDLLHHMRQLRFDYTQTFRGLADALRQGMPALGGVAGDWSRRWRTRLGHVDPRAVADAMDAVNPLYIPRNHRVEAALDAAVAGDLGPVEVLIEVLSDPFRVQPGREVYAQPAPDEARPYRTHCNT